MFRLQHSHARKGHIHSQGVVVTLTEVTIVMLNSTIVQTIRVTINARENYTHGAEVQEAKQWQSISYVN